MGESAMDVCVGCGAAVSTAGKFCGQCGRPLSAALPPQGRLSKWYHNIWFVLFMLFFVLGPFGLGLVWGNPRFGRGVKIVLTLVMVAYTAALAEMTIRTTQIVIEHLNQNNAILSF